jgi:amino acid adenylation domain-containing protein
LIEGQLDVHALAQSLSAIINRHENLRMRFVTEAGGQPVQIASEPMHIELPVAPTKPDEVATRVKDNAEHRFDLAKGPVVVQRLLQLGPERHLLLLNVHHIVADGWSIEGILFAELQSFYRAYCEGREANLAPLPIQYADFAAWQRKQDIADQIAYWRDNLIDYEGALELPTDYMRRPTWGERSGSFIRKCAPEFSSDLDRFSQRHNATLFMSLLAGLSLVAGRYTSKRDVCIGTTTSGRPQPELEGLIGFFINILPLRIQFDENWTVKQYMAEVRRLALKGFDNQSVPFERILQALGIAHGAKGNALVPLVIRHQNFPHTRMDKEMPGGVRFSAYTTESSNDAPNISNANARCEIELSYTGNRERLEVEVVYAADLYRKTTVERLLAHLEQVLQAMFENDDRRISDLPMLTRAEIHRICVEQNQTLSGSSQMAHFVDRFEQQVKRTPDKNACFDQTEEVTYRELAKRVDHVAQALRAKGMGPGDIVGTCLERGPAILASFLAVWKVGAAYVPLDPTYPESYLGQIIADATPSLVIGVTATLSRLGLQATQCLALDTELGTLAPLPESAPDFARDPSTLAYIMYTSGSTGVPKGARVLHQQLINWQGGIEANWPFETGDLVGQKTTIAFAPSAKELFAGLLNGAPQVFIPGPVVQDTAAFIEALVRYGVTRINVVPSQLEVILKHLEKAQATLPALRVCITAGEALTAELVSSFRVLLPHARLINNYGCTELNDIAYYDTADFDGQEGFVPVGKPVQNTRLYILDRDKRLVPEGVAGELHVSTIGMPDGYHNRPELNAAQFLPNPFNDGLCDRLFNTGDVVRRLPDGNLEYIGRLDFQVKIRGQRVDARHVEKILGEFPGIASRAVVGEGNQLLAYYIEGAEDPVDVGALRQYMVGRLPSHMVPASFIAVSTMPRLPNGKLDRRSLRPEMGQLQQSQSYESPVTDVERAIAAIWAEVLEIPNEEIGRNTNFFEIGGNSLAAARVGGHIKEKLQAEIGMSQLFELPQLADLARCVADARSSGGALELVEDAQSLQAPGLGAQGILKGKVVLITGASRGIGSATARLMASHGAKVAINYMSNQARAERVRDLIVDEGGVADIFQADVTDPESAPRMVDAVLKEYGKIDVLVSNAAIGFKLRSFREYAWGDFQRKLDGELQSMFNLCKAVVPGMTEQGGGSIIAISSSMSKTWGTGFIAHSAAKCALDSFVRSLACELGPDGIRVNTVAPGLILTDATANLSPHTKDAASARCPLRRNGLPRDIAGAVLFFASDLSQFLTGTYLPVDGGLTML